MGNSRLISTAPCHAAIEGNPKPQKLSYRQVLTPTPLVTPDLAPRRRLISEVHSLKYSPTKVAQDKLKTTLLFSMRVGGNSSHMGEKSTLTHPWRRPWVTQTEIIKVCRRSLWLLLVRISQFYSLRACRESWALNIDYRSVVSLGLQFGGSWVTASRLCHFLSIFGEMSLGVIKFPAQMNTKER